MSYESEERYWTDYLRVALPVIGLLLMLALFWWWAQNFIGDEKSPDEVANQISTEIATQAPPTPTFTVEATLAVTEAAGETPTTGGGVATDKTPAPDPTTQDCGYSPGDDVVTTDIVNLRSSAEVTDENLVETLPEGTNLQIISDCYESSGGTDFWQVKVSETAEKDWVAADYIQASDE